MIVKTFTLEQIYAREAIERGRHDQESAQMQPIKSAPPVTKIRIYLIESRLQRGAGPGRRN